MSFKFLRILLVVSWSLAQPVLATEASLRNDTDLLAEGKAGTPSITKLLRGTPVTVIKRKGIWFEIQVNEFVGWIKLSSMRFDNKSNFKSSLTELKTGREGSKNNVVATGVRGLEAENLELAKHDYEAFKKFTVIGINTELEQELDKLKKPRLIEDIAFHFSSRPGNREPSKKKRPTKPKSSQSIDIDDDF